MHHHNHLVQHIHKPHLQDDNTLHVVIPVSNVVRYHSRYRLMRECVRELEATPHVKVYIVELAFGHRHFECTESDNPRHLQLRGHQPIWTKESQINLGVKHLLPLKWKYMAWVDGDVFWRDPHWAQEAMHQLQHYSLIQPWRDCADLGYQGTILQHFKSFCYQWRRGIPIQRHPGEKYEYAHSGFAWACTRGWWEAVGGLPDWGLLGSSDHHMAWASVNHVDWSIHKKMHKNFFELAHEWQRKSFGYTHGAVGFVPTRIEHEFHGKKIKRRYRERWQILIDNHFDPINDIGHDSQGLVILLGKPKLLQACLDYMTERHEDEIGDY